MQSGDVRLDRPTLGDVPAIHAIYSDPRVWTHFPSGRHEAVEATEGLIRAWIGGWERDGLSVWIIRDVETGAVLGNAGCSVRRGTLWNLAYRLAHEAHGRGIASRVSAKAVTQAQQTAPALPVVAYLLEHNLASARVAEKSGLTLQHRGPDAGNADPEAVRLVYADRPLTEGQLRAVLA